MPDLPGTKVLREAEASFGALLARERRLQRDLLARAFAPVDASFDLLEQSGSTLREQAEAIEHAAKALEQAAGLMKTQAELYERAIRVLREPSRVVESAVGLGDQRDG